ncbi:MAG: D-alanyl-D-alanine carboxypeptidase [Clostridia bacterium]|nr:D-alanyl-D-alanine carboxypeptidase [Clostridia bacterium]
MRRHFVFFKRFLCMLLTLVTLLCPLCQSALAQAYEEYEYKAPRLPSDAAPYDPEKPDELDEDQLYAKSAILIEASSGDVIFEKDADAIMYPASTTKIMTLLLALMMGDQSQTVYLTDSAMWGIGEGDATMDLEVGESIVFEDLLYGTFIRSANEGANLIAETVAGSQEGFVQLMNEAAAMYGCTSTHFMNASGLQDVNHYTTVRDMAIIAREAMKNDEFRKIAKTYTYTLPASNLHRSRVLTHSSRSFFNPSLEENTAYYEYATGIKTGFTNAAGYCFVGSAERNGIELISVVFYTTADGRWSDTKKLMEYGFSQFVSMTPMQLYMENPITVETSGFSLDDPGYGRLTLNVRAQAGSQGHYIVATKDEMESKARNLRQTVLIEYSRDFATPITQGEVMGTMTYYPENGGSPVVYDLVASRSIERRENAPLTLEEIEALVFGDPNPFPPLSVELVLTFLLPAAGVFLVIRTLWRITHKSTARKRKKSSVKPQNRFYR